jgi:hypothetical protein
MRWLNQIAWFANFVGVTCGLYILLVAIDRNNQGEYIDTSTGALDYYYAALMFVAWYFVSAITTTIVLSIVLVLAECLFRLARRLLRS